MSSRLVALDAPLLGPPASWAGSPEARECCGGCGGSLSILAGEVVCGGCEVPYFGGDVVVAEGRAACYGCGWVGLPTFYGGRALLRCPRCEGHGNEPLGIPVGELWRFRRRRAPALERVSRNAPCPCGSGVKAKKCHPAACR